MTARRSSKITFESLTNTLMDECIHGSVHLQLCREIGRMDPVVGNLAPVFFNFSYFSHLNAALMGANRLFDDSGTSVKTLLSWADSHAGKFAFGSVEDVKRTIGEARMQLAKLHKVQKCLKIRRNNFLAHNSEEGIFDPEGMFQKAGVTYKELQQVFDEAATAINNLDELWGATTTTPRLLNEDDFKHVCELMAKQRCAEIKAEEAEFGIVGLIPERPRGCT
jgi:hypothetical protein